MSASIPVLDPEKPKRVLIVASNPAVSPTTGWPIGFWLSELTHPYWEFVEHGYSVEIASPDGGQLQPDSWSDPLDDSRYSAEDLISLGFVNSPDHAKLLDDTPALGDLDLAAYDALFLVGGQGPMVTFYESEIVHSAVAANFEAGRITALVCHATCVLLKARTSDGKLVVDGRTWTGFADSEEDYADEFVGQAIQPFRIEAEATKLEGTNFIVQGAFTRHAVRDGNLITGQQQYSGAAAARLVIEALGQ